MHGRGDQVGIHPHIAQAHGAPGRIIGMQGAEHEMAGHRGLDRDLGRLTIAHLAHHHHVGIMPQHARQRAREGQPDLGVHLGLRDPVQLILNRVLERNDLARAGIQATEAGIQGGTLAATGGARHKENPVRPRDVGFEQRAMVFREAQVAQVKQHRGRQNADHDILAMRRRHHRDAQIVLAASDPHARASVLRQAPLHNVEMRHQLDATDDGRIEMPDIARHAHVIQHPINAPSNRHPVTVGLEMDIRGAVIDRVVQHLVDQPHHGGVLGLPIEIVRLLGPLHHLAFRALGQDALNRLGPHPVIAVQGLADVAATGQHPLDMTAQVGLNILRGGDIEGIRHRHSQAAAVILDRHHVVM